MKLALGTAQIGQKYGVANTAGQLNIETASAIVHRSRCLGWDTLDTAIAYGDSELILGSIGVDRWKVVSKLPPVPDACHDVEAWVKTLTQDSLRRLKLPKLYGLLLHRPKQLLKSYGDELNRALISLKCAGIVEKIGISTYSPLELDEVWSRYQFDLVQAPLNVLDRRIVDSGWLGRLKCSGVEVHVRSAFLQGLLLLPSSSRPSSFNKWPEVWEEWDRWLSQTGLNPIQACLGYINSFNAVDRLVVGVDSISQLEEIEVAARNNLSCLPNFSPLKDDRLINPASWSEL